MRGKFLGLLMGVVFLCISGDARSQARGCSVTILSNALSIELLRDEATALAYASNSSRVVGVLKGGIKKVGAVYYYTAVAIGAVSLCASQNLDGAATVAEFAKALIGDDDNKSDCSKATGFQLRSAGILDEHAFKDEWVGQPVSRWDICACKDGKIVIRMVGLCGQSGPTHVTTETWK